MPRKLEITWVRSQIGTKSAHRGAIRCLGLRKLHQSVVHEDSPSLQGALRLVASLVNVKEVAEETQR